jgi:hypothetical protein
MMKAGHAEVRVKFRFVVSDVFESCLKSGSASAS